MGLPFAAFSIKSHYLHSAQWTSVPIHDLTWHGNSVQQPVATSNFKNNIFFLICYFFGFITETRITRDINVFKGVRKGFLLFWIKSWGFEMITAHGMFLIDTMQRFHVKSETRLCKDETGYRTGYSWIWVLFYSYCNTPYTYDTSPQTCSNICWLLSVHQ